MIVLLITGCIVLWVSAASGGEVCCDDECFSDASPFNHMPLPECVERINPQFRVFTRSTKNAEQILTRGSIPSNWDSSKRTMWLVHGYTQSGNVGWINGMKDALLEYEDANVIITDWYHGAFKLWYPQAASNTRVVGKELAIINNNLLKAGASPSQIWCIGHSLGAHLCGHAGRRTHMARITGMDPAGPWFENSDYTNGLGPDAADFVDVWHTHGTPDIVINLGTLKPLGHVDFYPNGGRDQPGCIIDTKGDEQQTPALTGGIPLLPDIDWALVCSHNRVYKLFLESLTSSCQMYARHQCYDAYNVPGACWDCGSKCQVMGPDADKFEGRGLFFLETGRRSPYCEG